MSLRSGFRLGDWSVYPLEGRLTRADEEQRIQPKSMEVLLCLAEAHGQVVERDVLLRTVWGERAVSDEPLTRCIGELRRALGDNRAAPAFIVTIPKRGYRLLAPVVAPDAGRARASRRSAWLVGAALVAVLVIGATGIGLWNTGRDTGEAPASEIADRSVVVLPFADMSPSGDQEYLSDGIAEEVLNLLARFPELRVISRTSAFSFKGTNADVRDIAERLGVSYVLEGSVRTSGRQIRITAQLIDARSDTHLWSAAYDRELDDVFAIQDEIATAVVQQLEMTLFADAPRSRPTDPEAYALFLRARYLHEHPAGNSFQRAFEYYEGALTVDPAYVPAWVWLAALYDDTVNSSNLPRDEVGRRAREAIDRALAIDGDDPMALGMDAVLTDAWDNDPVRAAAQMRRALNVDPGNPILLRWAVILLNSLGRFDEAVRVMEYLFAQDPIGGITKVNLASTYNAAGRYEDAVRVCRIEIELTMENGPCLSRLVIAYVYTGQGGAALGLLQQAEGSRLYTRLAPMVFHVLGRNAAHEEAMLRLQQAFADGDVGMAYWLGRNHVLAGDTGEALSWFTRAAEHGAGSLTPTEAWIGDLHHEPGWLELLEKTGRSKEQLSAIALEVTLP